ADARRDPDRAAAQALQWGVPVLESSITLIDGNRLYYRGHDVVGLARTRSVEEVAALVWTGRFEANVTPLPDADRTSGAAARAALPFVARAQSALAAAAARDTQAFDLRAEATALC